MPAGVDVSSKPVVAVVASGVVSDDVAGRSSDVDSLGATWPVDLAAVVAAAVVVVADE